MLPSWPGMIDSLEMTALERTGRMRPRKLTRRGADVRNRIISAMITCVVRSGFEATTVEHVMAEAALSRGSVLHQFPTRLELTVATAEATMRAVMADAQERSAAIQDPFERLARYPTIMWETHIADHGLALTDILLAARWDIELAHALLPVTSGIELQINQTLLALANSAGLADPSAFVAHGWLLLASTRGLIIEYKLDPTRPMILAAIDVLQVEHRRLCERLRATK
jgi:AcrR family transcriptional regulator